MPPKPSGISVVSADVPREEPAEAREEAPPSLDVLRDRIAQILARAPLKSAASTTQAHAPPAPVLARSWIDSVFARPHRMLTRDGTAEREGCPTARRLTPEGHRVGHVPVWTARRADPGVLALLALDPSLAGCDFERALYLDTETTGLLGGTGNVAFLLGLARYEPDEGTFVVEQLLLRNYADEPAMIEHLAARLEEASAIVTYNGKAFDMPLLRSRAIMNRLPALPERPHLDLLHVARRLHKHRLRACNLFRIEDQVLGRARVDDVGGPDIAAIYHHYVRSGDLAALEPVVEHNRLDVVSMIALVGLYGEPLRDWALAHAGPDCSEARAPRDSGPLNGGPLGSGDLAAFSKVVARAGNLDLAQQLADASLVRGGGAAAFRARGDVAKARGDKAAALFDYERALSEIEVRPAREVVRGDNEPAPTDEETVLALRLELAKLYEHHARSYDKALAQLAGGTSESPEAHERRAERLARRLARAAEITANPPKKRKRRLKASPI